MLQFNKDIFAWTHSDMPRIHLIVASHKLNVSPTSWPLKQKIQRFHLSRLKIIQTKIDKLLAIGFIKEVKYLDWLANVIVPKKDWRWWVYVDYTNLNDAYSKDSFPLPQIDQIVNTTIRHEMLSFLDIFFRIPLNPCVPTKQGENNLCHTTRVVLLQSHVVWNADATSKD